MKRTFLIVALAATLFTVACGSDNPLHSVSSPSPLATANDSGGGGLVSAQSMKLSTLDISTPSCISGVTYVGPIRIPLSVHGTTVTLSWLGNDGAIRGYELEFQRLDVTNTWLPALHDVVTVPQAEEFLHSEGTYRVRVRGLFCADFAGGFTDWVVFSTDGSDEGSSVAPPSLPPPCLIDCEPPPPPPPGDDEGGDDNQGGGGDHNQCDNGHNHSHSIFDLIFDHNNDGHGDCGQGNDNHHGGHGH